MSPDPSLSDLLKKLHIPADYARSEHITEASTLLELDHWKQGVHLVLGQILQLVREKDISLEDQGHIIFASSPFAVDFPVQPDQLPAEHERNTLDNWTTPNARQTAQGTHIYFLSANNDINLLAHPMFRSTCFPAVFIALSSTSGTSFCLQPEAHL